MGRVSYRNQEVVLETASRLRSRRFSCDAININVGWFERDWKCDLEFSRERFLDPRAMFERLGEMGFKTCLWQAPYAVDDLPVVAEVRGKGALATNHGLLLHDLPSPCDRLLVFGGYPLV